MPAAGAKIIIDGEETSFVTDENGAVTIIAELSAGEHVISAVSDNLTLVPPVCVVTAG